MKADLRVHFTCWLNEIKRRGDRHLSASCSNRLIIFFYRSLALQSLLDDKDVFQIYLFLRQSLGDNHDILSLDIIFNRRFLIELKSSGHWLWSYLRPRMSPTELLPLYSLPSVGRVEKSTSYKNQRRLNVQPIICPESLKVRRSSFRRA